MLETAAGGLRMRVRDSSGVFLDAEMEIHLRSGAEADVILHAGNGVKTNPDYFAALERILDRLGAISAEVTDIQVDSKVALKLPPARRRLPIPLPLALAPATDSHRLRIQITEAQRLVASKVPPAGRGGNKTKRIRLAVRDFDKSLPIADLPNWICGSDAGNSQAAGTYHDPIAAPQVSGGGVVPFNAEAHERARIIHNGLQRDLAAYLQSQGLELRPQMQGEPEVDLSWWDGEGVVVAEVKSLSGDETAQLRHGLGQLLDYQFELRTRHPVSATVLAVEYEPPTRWIALCAEVGVLVSWPPEWPHV